MRNARWVWMAVRLSFAGLVGMFLAVANAYATSVTLGATGGDKRIDLSWTVSGNLRGVQVMRDTDANPAGRQRVATLGGGVRSYADTAVENGRQYWYWIKYTDTAGASGNSNAGSATPAASNSGNNGNTGATCANAVMLSLPKVFTGEADTCLVTSGTIDSVNSWGAETVEINGVSYKSKWSNQMPARINGNYYIRYVAKQGWAHFEINGNGGSNDNGGGTPVANYTLSVGISGNGSTSISAGSHSYKSGTAVTITATPASGSTFSGWSGAFTGNTNPLTITMNGNKSLTAMFAAKDNGNGNNGQTGNAATDGLKNLATFPVGVAVSYGSEANSIDNSSTSAQQQAVVFKHFDQMTAGNIMKMSYLHPSEGSFTYGQADDFISLTRSHGLDVHGHTLIWHANYQVPSFMKNYSGDFAAMLKTHVQSIVTHFQGRVVSWDVVNEALADDGEATLANGLRSTVFSQKMGVSFIDQAFINARAADSNVDLFYNDYNTEAGGQKTKNLLALVDGMKSRGVPITGVGFQMHVAFDWPSISAIESAMKAIADRGLKVKISELDVGMSKAYSSFTADAAAKQKQRYHDIVAAYMRAVPPAQRAGITVWGVWDTGSWINKPEKPDWPLLFDANFQAKPALQGFGDALLGK
jgi:endo-1,4-beta-xylanase